MNCDFLSTALSFLLKQLGLSHAIHFCMGRYFMSCHGTAALQGHDVTLQNQFFLMGISIALQGRVQGSLLRDSALWRDLKGAHLKAVINLLPFGLSHIKNVP